MVIRIGLYNKNGFSLKKILFIIFAFWLPLILFVTGMLIPTFAKDLNIRVLADDIVYFVFTEYIIITIFVGFMCDIIKNSIKRTAKYKLKDIPIFALLTVALLFMSIALFARAKNSIIDMTSPNINKIGVVQRTVVNSDSGSSKVILINDDTIYNIYKLGGIEVNKTYNFRHYVNSNLLYMIEEIHN